jgi:hypothetical protein
MLLLPSNNSVALKYLIMLLDTSNWAINQELWPIIFLVFSILVLLVLRYDRQKQIVKKHLFENE